MKLVKYQADYDRDRVAYDVVFPSPLPPEQVKALFSALSTSISRPVVPLAPRQTVVVETWVSETGFSYKLLIPWQIAEHVMSEVRHLIPGASIEKSDNRPKPAWDDAAVIGLSDKNATINVANAEIVATDILSALVQAMNPGERAIMQWIIAPVGHEHPPGKETVMPSNRYGMWNALLNIQAGPGEIADLQAKLEHPRYYAVGHIAARAESKSRASYLVQKVIDNLRTANGAARFTARSANLENLRNEINHAWTPPTFPATLNAAEISIIAGLPLGAPYVTGLPSARTRPMFVPGIVPQVGTILGETTMPGSKRKVAVDLERRLQHTRILGPTSAGKTWLAVNMVVQDMEAGNGVVIIDPKGDLYNRVLDRIPEERIEDVIVWNLEDTDFPLGFNILRQGSSRGSIDELNTLLSTMYPESMTVPQLLYHGLHALAETGTFVDMPSMIKPGDGEEQWRNQLIRSVKDRHVRAFWEAYKRDSDGPRGRVDNDAAILARRIWPFVSRAEIRNSLGQVESSFTMPEVVSGSKILLVHLNGVRIGKQAAGIMGALILNALYTAVRTEPHEKPVMLYMDEFQNSVNTMPTDPADMLAESRSFGLSMNLIHQNIGQLTNSALQDAVASNCRTQIAFQLTTDAERMARQFGRKVTASDLLSLPARQAIAAVATENGNSEPFTLRTMNAARITGNRFRVLQRSREKYGRPVDEVEAAMEARRQLGAATAAPPDLFEKKLNQRNEGESNVR